jgi:hypothetical protein
MCVLRKQFPLGPIQGRIQRTGCFTNENSIITEGKAKVTLALTCHNNRMHCNTS